MRPGEDRDMGESLTEEEIWAQGERATCEHLQGLQESGSGVKLAEEDG